MSQGVVTARQLICEKLDEALSKQANLDDELDPRTAYSEPVQALYYQASAVASHKSSRQVTIYHLAYALVFEHPEHGKELAGYLNTDVDSFAFGCILQILPLGVLKSNSVILPPNVGAVRWLGKAAALAHRRCERNELMLDDLVRVVLDEVLPADELRDLRKAARVGRARHDAMLGPKPIQPIGGAPTSSLDIIKHLEEVEKGGAGPLGDRANFAELFEEFEQRYGSDLDEQKQALTRVEALIKGRPEAIEARSLPINTFMSKLEMIDRRVSALGEALPRPPSNGKLAAAIFTVLALGVTVGLGLSLWQSSARVSQVFSVSAK